MNRPTLSPILSLLEFPSTRIVLLLVVVASALFFSADRASADTLPQPFNTYPPAVGPAETGAQCDNNADNDGDGVINDGCPSAVECEAQGFEMDADIQVGTVPTAPNPAPPGCPGDDWSTVSGNAGGGSQLAVFQSGAPNIAACSPNNVNIGTRSIARTPGFPTSSFGCDSLALAGLVDCSTHTTGDKVFFDKYHIVEGGVQPKDDIENFYGVILSTTPPTLKVGFERVTNNGDTHLNFALKQSGDVLAGIGCPPTAAEISSGWTLGDLLVAVDYPGGTAQPNVTVFEVTGGPDATFGGTLDDFEVVTGADALGLTNCQVVKVQNQLRCADASEIQAAFWLATICEGTQDNPSGSAAGCRQTSTVPAGGFQNAKGNPEDLRPQRTFIEVQIAGNVINPCFSSLQVQSRASGESLTSALSDIGTALFPGCKIRIEKRDLQGNLVPGATFRIEPNPFACRPGFVGDPTKLDVTDNVAPDSNPTGGIIEVTGICPGTYTVTEIAAPPGYGLNPPAVGPAESGAACSNTIDDDGDTVVNDGCGTVTCTVDANNTTCTPPPVVADPLGRILIDKDNDLGNPLAGATFSISPNPYWCHSDALNGLPTPGAPADGSLSVTDGDANDGDPAGGQFTINQACLFGSAGPPVTGYTVTETAAPAGFAIADPASQGPTPLTQSSPNLTITFNFDNRRGSLAWEKRDGSLAGDPLQCCATFTVSPNPDACLDADAIGPDDADPLTVVDNGANDDNAAAGQIAVGPACLASYTITETVPPPGYALPANPTRTCTVTAVALNCVVGSQGTDDCANADPAEQDFCNRRGSLAWEKRDGSLAGDPLQGGATFTVSPNPDACVDADAIGPDDADPLTVVDNGANDDDPDAGQIAVGPACLAAYTITETVPPPGYALPANPTRTCTVTAVALNCVVGSQGTDDCANADPAERDFCNRRGSLAWEKRDGSVPGHPLQGGATFTVSPNPDACVDADAIGADDVDPLTVVDNGANDDNAAAGQIAVGPACLATYTITETVPPPGYALPANPTRTCTVSAAQLNCVVGSQGTDDCIFADSIIIIEQDFCNRRGSLAWEKRDGSLAGDPLQGGATFTVSPNPDACVDADAIGPDDADPLTVVDNGANDDNGVAGQIAVGPACLATYTITETVPPAGYALPANPTRTCTVSAAALNCVVGSQGTDDCANADPTERDFCNRRGSLEWEKRDGSVPGNPLQCCATFTVSPDPDDCVDGTVGDDPGPITVVDNGLNDDDPDAGQIAVGPACLATYTITETVPPPGYALPANPTRTCTVSAAALNCVVGSQGTDDCANADPTERDFCNRRGSLEWEKRLETNTTPHPLQCCATFTVSPNPDACVDADAIGPDDADPLTVVDNSPPDLDPDGGQLKLAPVCLGTYTITETVAPLGTQIDDDPTRVITVSASDLNAVIGAQGVDDDDPAVPASDESDFHNIPPREGCTPGFWKTHPELWDGVGTDDVTTTIQTTDFFNATFGVTTAQSGLANSVNLLQAQSVATPDLPAGSPSDLAALDRHTSAALVNADSGINFGFSVAQVISLYRDAVGADAGAATISTALATLSAANQLGCPFGANVLAIDGALRTRAFAFFIA